MEDGQQWPLISVIVPVKNDELNICNVIDSVLSQNYPNLELLVQDGGSSDRTVELAKTYGARINLASGRDCGFHDRVWRALQRTSGDIITVTTAVAPSTPDALARAVTELRADPGAGAITGSLCSQSANPDFDLVAFLSGDQFVQLSGTYFRRSAFQESGVLESPWREGRREPLDLEIWCRLGRTRRIKSIPHRFSSASVGPGPCVSASTVAEDWRLARTVLTACLFEEGQMFAGHLQLRDAFLQNLFAAQSRLFGNVGDRRRAKIIELAISRQLGEQRTLHSIVRAHLHQVRRQTRRQARLLYDHGVMWAARSLSEQHFRALRRCIRGARAVFRSTRPARLPAGADAAVEDLVPPGLIQDQPYVIAARWFAMRGLNDLALQMYRRAEELGNPDIDAEACQTALAEPGFGHLEFEQFMRRWGVKHASPSYHFIYGAFARRVSKPQITIGYHSSSWMTASTTARALSFIAQHDRSRFRIIGYSPNEESQELRRHFDEMRDATAALSDEAFVHLVREDQIDIFVELDPFSPAHRLRAMAQRCAPIQISYGDFLATSQVANVDYLLGDAISVRRDAALFCSEQIYRLPGCFLCYDFSRAPMPEVSAAPSLSDGVITFGNFDQASKLNRQSIERWAGVLKAVPNSRLLLERSSGDRDLIRRQLACHGIEIGRVSFLPTATRELRLNNYAFVDIGLDSWPHSSPDRLAEALWQGVPVVTFLGDHPAGGRSASLVTAAGLGDLIANTDEEFVDLAVGLAGQMERRLQLRSDLRSMCRRFGLADSKRMVTIMERASVEMMCRKYPGAHELWRSAAPAEETEEARQKVVPLRQVRM